MAQAEASAWGQLDLIGAAPPPRLSANEVRATETFRRAMDLASGFKPKRGAWKKLKQHYSSAFALAKGHATLCDGLARAIANDGSLWANGRSRARWKVARFDKGALRLVLRSDSGRTRGLALRDLFGTASRWRRVQ